MKKIAWIVLILGVLQSCGTSSEMPTWLEGTWMQNNEGDGSQIGERWVLKDGKLAGAGLYISGTDTTQTETLSIELVNGTLTYIATVPGNAAPVAFPATSVLDHELVFELPEYDFPKHIRYTKKGNRALDVHVEGEENGIAKGFELKLEKVQ